MKNELKLASTLNIVIAIIAYGIQMRLYPLVLIAFAIFYFKYMDYSIPQLYEKKSKILLISILNLFVNPLSGIIMLIGNDKLSDEYKKSDKKEIKKKELTSEERKISILLNLGIGLISLSGIILITTNWNAISHLVKIIILLFFSLLFMFLSILTEKKLKISLLSKNYWLLSMLFIILSIIGNGYFEVTSQWFSFIGKGHYLYLAFTSIVISLLAVITNNKYEKTIYTNICYTGIITSISFILLHFNIKEEFVLSIITAVLVIINIIKNDNIKDIKELSKYLTYIVSILSLVTISESIYVIPSIVLSIATIVNLMIITIEGSTSEGIISTIIINISILLTLSLVNLPDQLVSIIAMLVYSALYLINLLKLQNKTFTNSLNIVSNIIMLLIVLVNLEDSYLLCLLTSLITLTSIINYSNKTISYEKILLPIKIIILLISMIVLVEDIFRINPIYFIILLYIIIFVVYKLLKNEKLKKTTLIIYYIIFGIALMETTCIDIIPCILNLVASATTFAIIKTENNKLKTRISYILLLITIAFSIAEINPLAMDPITNGLIILLIYIMMTIITSKENDLRIINYLSIILPLIIMTNDNTIEEEITKILYCTQGMYVVLLINLLLLKNDRDRNIATTILTIAILLRIIFIESWIIGLYVGIISLILLIIGFMKKEYKSIFIEGIVLTIVNILVQFNYMLKELPLWLYTLFAGLILIAIVTYKIINDNKEK